LLEVLVEVRRRHDKEAIPLWVADKRLQFAFKPGLGHGIEPMIWVIRSGWPGSQVFVRYTL
jgi:hypothetical protein